jgi:flagellin-specific chaperone FliS
MQVRKWNEEVNRAKDAVRQKRIFKDSLGRQQSTVDEEKHLKKCQRILEEAEQKLANTRRHAKQLQREHLLYRGGVQRLATALASDMPNAIAMLDRVTEQLEKYVSAAPTLATSDAGPDQAGTFGTEAAGSMKRAVEPDDEKPVGEANESVSTDTNPKSD